MSDEDNQLTISRSKTMHEDDIDEVEDETTDGGVLFYVNNGGFPVNSFTWERMWNHVAKLNPSGSEVAKEIRSNKQLPEVPIPRAPIDFPVNFTTDEKLEAVQNYMNELQYNHTGTQLFEIRKNRPISGLMESAREMIREALPIKCLEAVILSLYLTNGVTNIDRFPVSFKTVFMGNVFRHVVLGVYSQGRYGALGMSRRKDLMYKPLEFRSLSDLVLDYIKSYKRYFHDVKKAKVGLPVPHDAHSYESINWKHLSVTPKKSKRDEMCREIDRHAREMRQQRSRLENLRTVYSMGPEKGRNSLNFEVISPTKVKEVPKTSSKTRKSKNKESRPSPQVKTESMVTRETTVLETSRRLEAEMTKRSVGQELSSDNKDQPRTSGTLVNYQIRV